MARFVFFGFVMILIAGPIHPVAMMASTVFMHVCLCRT